MYFIKRKIYLLGLLLFQFSLIHAQTTKTFFVASNGSDNGEGTIESPFETLGKALSEVKKEAENTTDKTNFQVYLREGTYFFTRGENLNNFSGKGKVSLSSYENEKVVFHGGEKVKGSAFKLCKDKKVLERLLPEARGKVWEVNLKKEGITNYGTMKQHGFGTTPEPTPMELFINGKPQQLARYPNEGILQIDTVYDGGSKPRWGDRSNRGGTFGYSYDRIERWKNANEIWLHGKFSAGYNDDHLKVDKIDYQQKSIKVAQAHLYGIESSIYDKEGKLMDEPSPFRGYYAYNLMEEIDQPGEYCLDRETGKIYIYPQTDLSEATIEVSINEDPFLELVNASNIEINGITFTCSRGLALYLGDCKNITIDRCTFSNLGTVAVSLGQTFKGRVREYNADGSPKIENYTGESRNVTISNCKVYYTGTGGVVVNGGDRENLVPGNNLVYNTEFYGTDRVNNTYSPSIRLSGIGNVVRNCYFHDLKHQAIGFSGNDHLIEYCRFDHVCTDADDMGAIYTGRNPSARGTVIRKNYFSNIQPQKEEISMCGVYFDDGSGGMTVEDNLFYKVGNPGHYQNFAAIFMHGGHDNKIMRNVFVDCPVAVGQSPWDDNRWAKFLESDLMVKNLRKDVNITSATYLKKYPELEGFFSKISGRTNYVAANVLVLSLIARNGDFILRKNITDNNAGDSPENISFDGVKKILPAANILPLDEYGIIDSSKKQVETSATNNKVKDKRTEFFPTVELKAEKIPTAEKVWVFMLAGQSNMAGRGQVEPQDTVPNNRILTINKNGELIVAKEPLHFYERDFRNSGTGLDCGLSFGRTILKQIPNDVSILIIPTAVGGSSISQWLEDENHRGVNLLSNFKEKAALGMKYGQIKGILWHQGEADAKPEKISLYKDRLSKLFSEFRETVQNAELPIVLGELGSYSKNYENWQAINKQIEAYAATDTNASFIKTNDLIDKGDKVHFNTEGQRIMGQRFAEELLKIME